MDSQHSHICPIPKTIRPRPARPLLRRRLFEALQEAGRSPGVVWITSPGGAGKTTLVSSFVEQTGRPCVWYELDEGDADPATFFYYLGLASRAVTSTGPVLPSLGPEQMSRLSVFAKRFAEGLTAAHEPGTLIVLDNFHELADSVLINRILVNMAEALGEGITLVVISRHYPPSYFSRLRANRNFSIIDWNDIRFTVDEWLAFAERAGYTAKSKDEFIELHRRSDGWISGLILTLPQPAKHDGWPEAGVNKELIFDYFAAEVFDQASDEVQSLLLRTAFLPHVSVPAARLLTGCPAAEEHLRTLARGNFFVVRLTDEQYTYHRLFRTFLQDKVHRCFARGDYEAILKTSAEQLVLEQQFEAAAGIFIELGDWRSLTALILENAEPLVASGRFHVLHELLVPLPQQSFDESPWLTYWLGMARLVTDSGETMNLLRQAHERFMEIGEAQGAYLSWYQASQLMSFTWRHTDRLRRWLDRYTALRERFPEPPAGLPWPKLLANLALTFFMSGHDPAATDEYLNQLEVATATSTDPLLTAEMVSHLLFVRFVQGYGRKSLHYMHRLEALTEGTELGASLSLNIMVNRALAEGFCGSPEQGVELANTALEFSAGTGIDFLDCLLQFAAYTSGILFGDASEANDRRQSMSRCAQKDPVLVTIYHYNNAWAEILRNRPEEGLENSTIALNANAETGIYPYRLFIKTLEGSALWRKGEWSAARETVTALMPELAALNLVSLEFQAILVDARVALESGENERLHKCLTRAWQLARNAGIRRYPGMDIPLCNWAAKAALEDDIEPDAVREFITTSYHLFEAPPQSKTYWRWPVQIYSLGRYDVLLDGKSLIQQSRREQKPLLLLKTLVDFGGSATVEQIIHEYSTRNVGNPLNILHTHLHRLRKSLGGEHALLWQGNTIAINKNWCWLDVYAFEELTDPRRRDGGADEELILSLYRGEFMPGSEDNLDALTRREWLRERFLRYVLSRLEQLGDAPQSAALLCAAAIEAEPTAESLHQKLISLYLSEGHTDLAKAAFARCVYNLQTNLDCPPSEETVALLRT